MQFEIMNRSGHDTESFTKGDKVSMAEAERRFNELRAEGKYAVDKSSGVADRLVTKFDPTVTAYRFQPQNIGG
jgi:hypothetical protein